MGLLLLVGLAIVGGAACPPALMTAFSEELGVELCHAWGMTELSPLGCANRPKHKHAGLSPEERDRLGVKQGRTLYGVDLRIVDDAGRALPHDGTAAGDLHVRGPWVTGSYFLAEPHSALVDGWFPTGDVATIDADGYMHITDRSKDVIKSGGEWISSIALENLAMSHPAIAEAAVIGVPHPKWDERPLLLAVKKPGGEVSREALLAFFIGKVAKFWLPDDVVFVPELPHTATGKISKMQLRERYRTHALPSA